MIHVENPWFAWENDLEIAGFSASNISLPEGMECNAGLFSSPDTPGSNMVWGCFHCIHKFEWCKSEYGCSGHIQKQFQGNPQGSWLNPLMYWLILAHAFNIFWALNGNGWGTKACYLVEHWQMDVHPPKHVWVLSGFDMFWHVLTCFDTSPNRISSVCS